MASPVALAEEALARLVGAPWPGRVEEAEVIVALGGDGLMLSTLHATERAGVPVYGMNRGTVGFLMNALPRGRLLERLAAAEEAVINPLRMRATRRGRRGRRGAGDQRGLDPACRAAGGQAADPRRRARAAGGAGRRRGAALHAGGLDRLQLFGARADPADRRRHPGADADGGVPAAALARRAAAEGGAR